MFVLVPLLRWSTWRAACASGWRWRTAARCPFRSWGWLWWPTPCRRPPSTRSASTAKCLSPGSTWISRSSTVRTGRVGNGIPRGQQGRTRGGTVLQWFYGRTLQPHVENLTLMSDFFISVIKILSVFKLQSPNFFLSSISGIFWNSKHGPKPS